MEIEEQDIINFYRDVSNAILTNLKPTNPEYYTDLLRNMLKGFQSTEVQQK